MVCKYYDITISGIDITDTTGNKLYGSEPDGPLILLMTYS